MEEAVQCKKLNEGGAWQGDIGVAGNRECFAEVVEGELVLFSCGSCTLAETGLLLPIRRECSDLKLVTYQPDHELIELDWDSDVCLEIRIC